MTSSIKLKNPCYIQCTTFIKNNSFSEENLVKYLQEVLGKNIENKIFAINEVFQVTYHTVSEVDLMTIEIRLMVKDKEAEYENLFLVDSFLKLGIESKKIPGIGEIITEKYYIICSNFLDLHFSDELLYNIYYKKLDEIRYLYSSIEHNEFITNFLKHIIKFDIYYAKILSFYKKFSTFSQNLQKSNIVLIEDYSKIIEGDITNFKQDNLIQLNKKINNLQAINFGLMYDMESLDSNLENLESRLKTIGGENSRYFLNHIEKAKFIIENFDSVLKKNTLIKENILDNYLNFVKNNIEQQKLEQEKSKINHIKNIKEILGSLACIEIFINGIAESSKIFEFEKSIAKILENTAFMRMSLLIIFIIGYFIWYYVKNKGKSK